MIEVLNIVHIGSGVALSSNAVHATTTSPLACGKNQDNKWTVEFQHGPGLEVTNRSTLLFFECFPGKMNSTSYLCEGKVHVASCSGNGRYSISVNCMAVVRPLCLPLSNNVDTHFPETCRVVNFTPDSTTCVCDMCASKVQGRLLTEVAANTVAVVSAAELTSELFVSVVNTATSINSVDALEASKVVLIWMGTLWGFFIFVFLLSEKFGKEYSTISDVDMGPPIEKASAGAQREDLKIRLHSYVGAVFPVVFSNLSLIRRIDNILLVYHPLLATFVKIHSTRFQRSVGIFRQLTIYTYDFFIIALMYEVQYPSDDGTCKLLSTERACLSEVSWLNSEQKTCTWITAASQVDPQSTYAASSGGSYCAWVHPTFNIDTMIIVNLVVLIFMIPFQVILYFLFDKIMLAPTSSETLRSAGAALISRARRASRIAVDGIQNITNSVAKHLQHQRVSMF